MPACSTVVEKCKVEYFVLKQKCVFYISEIENEFYRNFNYDLFN